MASRNIFLPKESNRRIPNGTYGGVRGMNNLYSIGERSEPISRMLALLMIKTFKTALRSLENRTTALAGEGNAPLSPPAAVLPPEGEVLAALCLEMLMR